MSRGVTWGIVSIPTSRWSVAEVISAFIRARAIGLSFTSTKPTRPEAWIVRVTSTSPSSEPPFGGSSSTETTHSPVAERARERRLAPRRAGARDGERRLVDLERRRGDAAGRRAPRGSPRSAPASCRSSRRRSARRARPPARRTPRSSRASSGGRRPVAPARLASPMFGSAASGSPASRIPRSARSATVGPAPWFVPIAATSSCGEPARGRCRRRPRPSPPPRRRRSGARRSAATRPPRTASTATTSSSRSKNVSIMKRSTPRPSSTCACSA